MNELDIIPDKIELRDGLPHDLEIAIKTFFEATKMIKDGYVERMPGEYVANLLDVMNKYPEYKTLTRELNKIVMEGINNGDLNNSSI